MSALWDTDYLWREVQGAKLASLFGLDQAESQGNESFQFTAPKQPKKTPGLLGQAPQKPAPLPCAPAVLFATAVHAFCFVNGQYVKQGKIGAAVLGNHVTKEYKILLYGSKQKQITTARIHRAFSLIVQIGSYVTFYDDHQQSWSLMFDSGKARPEFCREVCLAKWNSEASESLLFQDLVPGEGPTVHVGDTVEVVFSGWLLQNHSLGQKFDSNLGKEKLERVKLGAGKATKGWEEGILGMQKGGRRLLIFASSLCYGSKGSPKFVPAHSTLVYDVEIHRVKYRQSGSADNTSTSTDFCSDTSSVENRQKDKLNADELKAQASKRKLESISKFQSSSCNFKTTLISRIAKMGKPMLPFLTGAIPAQSSDSEAEDIWDSGSLCDSSSSKPVQIPSSSPPLSHQLEDCLNQEVELPRAGQTQDCQSFYSTSDEKSFKVHPAKQIPHQTALDLPSFLICDARQHNKETLMAITQLAHRVDNLTCKVNDVQKSSLLSELSLSLQTNKILYNIQRKGLCVNKEVIEELEEPEQRYMDQEQKKSDCIQSEPLKVDECCSSCTHSGRLQQEQVNLQQRSSEIQAELNAALSDKHKLCTQISQLETCINELVKQGKKSEQQWREEKQRCKEMQTLVQSMDEEMQDLKAEKDNLRQLLSERKRKWQAERERIILKQEEEEEKSHQGMFQLLVQLRQSRNSTSAHMKQAEFELDWQMKCEAALKEQKRLEGMITELQEQVKKVLIKEFQALWKAFDPRESYCGNAVLENLRISFKRFTLKLLSEQCDMESDIDNIEVEEAYLSTQ